jgi:hypothetical protein
VQGFFECETAGSGSLDVEWNYSKDRSQDMDLKFAAELPIHPQIHDGFTNAASGPDSTNSNLCDQWTLQMIDRIQITGSRTTKKFTVHVVQLILVMKFLNSSIPSFHPSIGYRPPANCPFSDNLYILSGTYFS